MTPETPLRADRDAAIVAIGEHRAEIAYDPDGEVWFVRAASLPGIAGEAAATREALEAALPALVAQASLP